LSGDPDTRPEVEPALSREEWERVEAEAEESGGTISDVAGCLALAGFGHKAIALLNHALPDGDPRKLTWWDAENLRRSCVYGGCDPESPTCSVCATRLRIQRVLPPSEPIVSPERARELADAALRDLAGDEDP
jgi:hypothetical protein